MNDYELGWIGECARAACLTEALARKPGNVHPEANFTDLSFADFVASAHAIAPVMACAPNVSATDKAQLETPSCDVP